MFFDVQILQWAGVGGAVLLAIGCALNAPKHKDPKRRRWTWVLCGVSAYVALAIGSILIFRIRGVLFHGLLLPGWVAMGWLFVHRRDRSR